MVWRYRGFITTKLYFVFLYFHYSSHQTRIYSTQLNILYKAFNILIIVRENGIESKKRKGERMLLAIALIYWRRNTMCVKARREDVCCTTVTCFEGFTRVKFTFALTRVVNEIFSDFVRRVTQQFNFGCKEVSARIRNWATFSAGSPTTALYSRARVNLGQIYLSSRYRERENYRTTIL